MRVTWWGGAAMAAAMLTAPALADVKAGVDAWGKGDYRRAIEEWRGPAVKGDADAQFNLGQAYKLGRGVPIDLPVAEGWYRKAALQGHVQAEDNYGLALFQNNKRAEARPWLEKAATRGEPRAQYVLGTMLFNGDGVAKDWVRAYALTVRASQAGLPQAGQSLAQMDRYLSAADRQRGAELARTMEANAGRPSMPMDVADAPPPVSSREVRQPVQTADVPRPGARYPAPPPRRGDSIRSAQLPPSVAADPEVETMAPLPPPASVRPVERRSAAAPARPAVGTGWRVQLGAFRDRANAEALWERTRGRVAGLRPLQPIMVRAGAVTKLQAGPLGTAAQATTICRQVKAAGTDCLTVAP